jgi:hypothetical protein
MPSPLRKLLHLPSRVALLLGLSALSVASAEADTGASLRPDRDGTRIPQQSARPLADIAIWADSGRIFVSEAGRPAEELHLGNTAEAELLERMLNEQGATASAPRTLRDRIILVGGGGDGFHWAPKRSEDPNQTSGSASRNSDKLPSETTKTAEQAGVTQPPSNTDSK